MNHPGSIIRKLDNEQYRTVKRLVRDECANYYDNACLVLCDSCPQLCSRSIVCRYFQRSVLPLYKLLYNQLYGKADSKVCSICGKDYIAYSNRSKYCEQCSKSSRKRYQAVWVNAKRKTLSNVDI